MLAHNGMALITEKLQNQRLEESSQASCCSKLPQVTQDNAVKPERPFQSNLAVKGKNVWAMSVESERQAQHDFGPSDFKNPSRPPDKGHRQSLAFIFCQHKKLRTACWLCDTAPGTPSAPPKKKHCRSLSVPPDGSSTCLPTPGKQSKIWRPIAVIPLSTNPGSKDRSFAHVQPPHSGTHDTAATTKWLPKLTTNFVKLVPSPSSVDSGHFTTSDLQTPPGSPVPVPRPASATSETSFSSLGSAWHDYYYSPMRARSSVLENRSLSYEDRISVSSSVTSMPYVHIMGSDTPSRCRSSSQDDSNAIPRCHSQPCVLHHRRCGKKRRRDCDRPTLNFNKMTETAYTRSHRRSDPWSTPVGGWQSRPQAQNMLNPIASSPLDSEFPVMANLTSHQSSYPSSDVQLSHAASIALPLTPPDSGNSPSSLSKHPKDRLDDEDEEEEDTDEAEQRDCTCHDSRADHGLEFCMSDIDLEQIEND